MSRSVKGGAAVVCRSCQTLGLARRTVCQPAFAPTKAPRAGRPRSSAGESSPRFKQFVPCAQAGCPSSRSAKHQLGSHKTRCVLHAVSAAEQILRESSALLQCALRSMSSALGAAQAYRLYLQGRFQAPALRRLSARAAHQLKRERPRLVRRRLVHSVRFSRLQTRRGIRSVRGHNGAGIVVQVASPIQSYERVGSEA